MNRDIILFSNHCAMIASCCRQLIYHHQCCCAICMFLPVGISVCNGLQSAEGLMEEYFTRLVKIIYCDNNHTHTQNICIYNSVFLVFPYILRILKEFKESLLHCFPVQLHSEWFT